MIYADWRAFVNAVRTIRKSPGRLLVWLIFVAMLSIFIVIRAHYASRHLPSMTHDVIAQADEVASAIAALLLVTFASGRSAPSVFRSQAEARFIIGSRLSAALTIPYLVVRNALLNAGRYVVSYTYLLFLTIPSSVGPLQFVGDLLLVIAFSLAMVMAMLPRRLAKGPAAWAGLIGGGALALVFAASGIRAALDQFMPGSDAAALADAHIPLWHPGTVLLAPGAGWLLLALALAGASLGVLVLVTRDVYPELYALSLSQITLREAMADKSGFAARMEAWRGLRATNRPARAVSASAAPGGALIFVWRSFIEYRRRVTTRTLVLQLAIWFAVGYAGAWFFGTESVFAPALLTVVVNLLIAFGSTASSSLALEMRRPMFWLSPALLAERFGGFALGQVWPQWLRALVAAGGAAAAGGSGIVIAGLAIGVPALLLLLLGTGYAMYAILPASIDQRGPLAFVRILLSYLLLVPAVGLFALFAFAFGQSMAGLAIASLVAVLEAAALIGFAAWRLDGRVDLLASA